MSFEKTGLAILKTLGFEKIRYPKPPERGLNYDRNAEKDGIKYAIEIKSTAEENGKFTVPVDQLRAMASQLKDERRKPLLLLMDESRMEDAILDYYLFELKGISFGSFEDIDGV